MVRRPRDGDAFVKVRWLPQSVRVHRADRVYDCTIVPRAILVLLRKFPVPLQVIVDVFFLLTAVACTAAAD